MRVLALNCGSSTLKFEVLDLERGADSPERVAHGAVERIGGAGAITLNHGKQQERQEISTADHREAFQSAHRLLEEAGSLRSIDAVGHRVVHGGPRFRTSTLIDSEVIAAIRDVSALAPLHNGPSLAVIDAARDVMGQEQPMVAVFDTAFFAALPEVATRYALPRELAERHGIRRFGFHGLAHADMTRRFRKLRPDLSRPRLITLQLGGGCSIAASLNGEPLDTSMGYTPLEGLIMGTRSGDIDPAIPLRLQSLTGMTAEEVEDLLNTGSGLLGLSGRSSEMRDLVPAAAAGDNASAFAVEAFCVRAKKYVGAYLALLGGTDGLVFGGGIGENMPEVRGRICSNMEWAGLLLDEDANQRASGPEVMISRPGSKIDVWVVRVDEAAVIARETLDLLTSGKEYGDATDSRRR